MFVFQWFLDTHSVFCCIQLMLLLCLFVCTKTALGRYVSISEHVIIQWNEYSWWYVLYQFYADFEAISWMLNVVEWR